MDKRVTMEMIAKACRTSIGTVDRALNNRSGINAETKKNVLDTAAKLGYRANVLASALSRRSQKRIALIYPTDAHEFYLCMKKGVEKAAEEFAPYGVTFDSVNVDLHNPASQLTVLSGLDIDKYDAVAINPFSNSCKAYIKNFTAAGKPVALFNNDLPTSGRLFYVGSNSIQSGQVGGEVMGLLLNGRGAVTVLGDFVHIMPFYERFEGFCRILCENYPDIEIYSSPDCRLDRDLTEKNIRNFLNQNTGKCGIFCTGYSCTDMAAKILKDMGRPDVALVGYDVSDATADAVRNGYCKALLYQDPFRQGYQTASLLARHITEGWMPQQDLLYIEIRIVFRQNINNYAGGILRSDLFI